MTQKVTETEPEELDDEVVELVDEEGNKSEYYHIGTMEYEGEWYAFFQPADEDEEDEESDVVIFRLDESEDSNELFPVEDEALLDAVFAEFCKQMEEEDAADEAMELEPEDENN